MLGGHGSPMRAQSASDAAKAAPNRSAGAHSRSCIRITKRASPVTTSPRPGVPPLCDTSTAVAVSSRTVSCGRTGDGDWEQWSEAATQRGRGAASTHERRVVSHVEA